MAPQTATRLTYEEFMALPEEEGKHYELIEGELVLNPAPVTKHQRILRKIFFALCGYFEKHRTGEVFVAPFDAVLSHENVLQPDLLVVKGERAHLVGAKNLQGAPSLTIEILSEASRRKDEVTKRRLYERFGVDEYWIIDPEIDGVKIYRRSGEVFVLAIEINTETGGSILSPLLPEFVLDVNAVFSE